MKTAIIERLDMFSQPLYWLRGRNPGGKAEWTPTPSEARRLQGKDAPEQLLRLNDSGWRGCKILWLQEENTK